jgi:hypothetical protein
MAVTFESNLSDVLAPKVPLLQNNTSIRPKTSSISPETLGKRLFDVRGKRGVERM